jgi:hypothetical protein
METLTSKYKVYVTNKKLSKKEFKVFQTDCVECMKNINKNLQTCIDMFNTLIDNIGTLLAGDFPNDQTICTYSSIVSNIVKTKPLEPISLFIMNVYKNDKYREYIMQGNDNFFLNNDHKDVTNNDENTVQKMFQFKTCWTKLSHDNKDYIKNVMKTLIQVSTQYIIEKDNGNMIPIMLNDLESFQE